MTLLTLAGYLIGSREAILRLAGCRWSLVVGFIFVLVAGFAREYDGEDLLHEPWHVLIPLGASLTTSALLYLLVRGVAWGHGAQEPHLVSGYLDFLGLYWLTAPLALVYAIPVERLLPAAGAVEANLWLLGLVSLWRVLLMARVVSVLFGTGFFTAFFIVMLFADTVAAFLLAQLELPILSVMGGIRLSESEMVLQLATLVMRGLTAMTWPLWLIATGIAVFRKQPKWEYQPTGYAPYLRVATHLWATSALLLVMWAFILPITQPEQQLRGRVERALVGGQVAEGLALMSVHEPGDFPPHWDPPPRVAYREQRPDITEIQEQLSGVEVKPWVRDIFDDKFSNWLLGDHRIEGALAGLPASEIERRIKLIEDMPARQKVLRENEDHLRRLTDEYSALPPDLKKRIRSLLEEAAILVPASSSAAAATDP
jgi:hypothetical protein